MLRGVDAACDFTEIAFRAIKALHKKPGPEHS